MRGNWICAKNQRLSLLDGFGSLDKILDRSFRDQAGNYFERYLIQFLEADAGLTHVGFDAHPVESLY